MNREESFDRLLEAWLDDGADVAPERFVWEAIAQVDRTPQRGAWRAFLGGFLMRLQPVAPILGFAAIAIAAIALYAAFAQPNVGDSEKSTDPTPFATRAAGSYATARFAVPIAFSLDTAGDAEGWEIRESRGLVTARLSSALVTTAYVFAADATSVVAVDGTTAPLPDDLVAWLNEQPGIETERSNRPDTGQPETLDVLGQEARVIRFTVDAASAGDRALLRTSDGAELRTGTEPASGMLLAVPSQAGDLLYVYYGPVDEEGLNWTGAFLRIAESTQPQ